MEKPIAVRLDIHKDLTCQEGIKTEPHISLYLHEGTGELVDKIMSMVDHRKYLTHKIIDFKGREYFVNSNLELELTEEFQELPF